MAMEIPLWFYWTAGDLLPQIAGELKAFERQQEGNIF
jgi:hypothetical protein